MGEPSLGPDKADSVKSALRVLEIFELLTVRSKPLSFSEIQQRLGYPKASLHGLLRTMTAARWLAYDQVAKGYVLGVRVWEAGIAYTSMLPLEAHAKPHMERLCDLTTETVQLAILDNFDVLYIGKVKGQHMLRLDSAVGTRLEPHATGVGKVLLAGLAIERLQAWMADRRFTRYTANTIVEPQKLVAELQAARESGYATDREERTLGASCIAVGIRDHSNALVAAISVSAPAVRFGEAQRSVALVHLRRAAIELSAALGHVAYTPERSPEEVPRPSTAGRVPSATAKQPQRRIGRT